MLWVTLQNSADRSREKAPDRFQQIIVVEVSRGEIRVPPLADDIMFWVVEVRQSPTGQPLHSLEKGMTTGGTSTNEEIC